MHELHCLKDIITEINMDRMIVGFTTTYAIGAYHH
jgi:hypothetical protein